MSKFVEEINVEDQQKKFDFFIKNLKGVSYYNKGTFGYTFILEINDQIDSPYKYIDSDQKINKVLLKICGICNLDNCQTKKNLKIITNDGIYNVSTLSDVALKKECELQNKVYACGKQNNDQLCPKMFYCENITGTEITNFLNLLIKLVAPVIPTGFFSRFKEKPKPSKEYNILNGILQNLTQIDGLYISLMEYADGYKTISNKSKEEENYARAALLKLALYCSISHNDPNHTNILINRNNNHILLIDFGSTIHLHDKEQITPEE